jgi:hypothetical protein
MIDLEKLKLAMELVDKIDYGISYHRDKTHAGNPKDTFCLHHYGSEERYIDIDELISKLQELTTHESKYKVGDKVWFIDCTERDGPICNGIIESIETITRQFNEQCNFIKIECYQIPEDCCYPSREALIDAQINYWYDLKMEKVKDSLSKCIPKFEGEIKGFKSLAKCNHKEIMTNKAYPRSNPPQKCDDCGELYR